MSETWCPLPWMHQFVTTKGVKTCCESLYEESTTPGEFVNSPVLADIKNTILQGRQHRHCASCFKLEQQGFTSIRQESVRNWPQYHEHNVPQNVEYLELRYNNLCNFSCKMCSPDFSSAIGNLVERNSDIQIYFANNTKKTNSYDLIYQDIEKQLATVRKINFAGGEPLLNKDNIRILQKLVEFKNTNCEICIITNASAINPQWLDILRNFRRIHWTISLDGIGQVAEYIRVGTDWPTVAKNIETILSLGNSVAFNTTLSAYSVLDLSNTIKFFINHKKNITTPFEHWFGLCQWPEYLRPGLLRAPYVQKAKQELEISVQLLSNIPTNPARSIMELRNVLENLESITDQPTYDTFGNFTKQMDKIHNQSFAETFRMPNPYRELT